jgi:hemolysin activation/secretion protein
MLNSMKYSYRALLKFPLACGLLTLSAQTATAQTIAPIPVAPIPDIRSPLPTSPLPSNPLPSNPLPPAESLLKDPSILKPVAPPETSGDLKIKVDRFEVVGSTVFTTADFDAITKPFIGRELSFTDVLQARSAITKLYTDKGYITTGALVAPQNINKGIVKIQVIEGQLEDIAVKGNARLKEKFLRDRIKRGAGTPLNVPHLLENLQSLRLDPRIKNLSADLQSGIRPGSNRLEVQIEEAKTFSVTTSIDNARSPSVGSFRRKIELREANLLGFGDTLNFGYSNTNGSNSLDVGYNLPINAKNGAISFNYSGSRNRVIEKPFSALDILSKSRYYELGFRQPLIQKPTQELAIGFNFARQESQTELGIDNIGPFPLSPGADAEGKTKISAVRFFQEYTQRSNQQVFALRSQFSLGLNVLNPTINDTAPDSRFATWRGQAQWVRQFSPDSLFLLKGDLQFADRTLVPLEQFGLGGASSVRGYRQDALLSDAGALVSAEFRLPIVRSRGFLGTVQLAPFFDFGTAWNKTGKNPGSLFGTGVGLIWKQSDRLNARLDWGIPLSKTEGKRRSLQENGVYFSVNYSPF